MSFQGGKTLTLDVGVGSGAFHYKGDPVDEFYTITDKGANIGCAESGKVLNIVDSCFGKIFPLPSFTPTIYKFDIDTGGTLISSSGYEVIQTIKIKDRDDNPISGLPNPLLSTENAYDNNINRLDFDPEGLDTEAIVKLSNGTFWLADEYAPSLVHVAANGRILERIVPAGIEDDLAAANYRVVGALPSILKKRQLNRGIESLAISSDGQFLYFMMESPLADPDGASFSKSRYVRLFKVSLRNFDLDSVVGEYVYVLDEPDTFTADNTNKQSDVKISEMVVLGGDKLIILEHVTRHTKLYRLSSLDDATNILGTEWDNEATNPSLEKLSDLTAQGITPVEKNLVFDSRRDISDLDSKIEGIAVLNDEYLVFINDNDFSIEGAQTRIRIAKRVKQLNQ